MQTSVHEEVGWTVAGAGRGCRGKCSVLASSRKKILELQEEGVLLNEIAVLFRSSFSHSFDLEIELSRCGLPFVKRGGIKFIEAAHVEGFVGPFTRGGESAATR